MTGGDSYGFSNSVLWTWDSGTSSTAPAAYTSYRSDRSLELQFENSNLKAEVAKLRRDFKAEVGRHADHIDLARARSNAMLDEIEALHVELETLRQALAEALK